MHNESIEVSTAAEPYRAELGRLELLPEAAISLQIDLMRRMLPEDIRILLKPSDGETLDGIEDDLFMRWYEKYAVLFADFCNEQLEDSDLMDRLKTQTPSAEDYDQLIRYLQHHTEDKGAFLKSGEVTDLVKKYGH